MGEGRQKRILITGGAGFIGSHLCGHYLRRGHAVLALDNFITGSPANVRHLAGDRRFRLIRHDISKPIRVLGRLDVVMHFASPASPPDYLRHPIQTMKAGANGTHNALGIAKKHGATFLLASTSEVYGDPAVSPQPESYWGNVNPVGPRGVYDEAKRYAEALTLAYRRQHRMDVKIVRIFNTYGERMRPEDGRVIPNFITQALTGRPLTVYGDGSQTRSYCYVDDLVRGIDALLGSRLNGPVNIGNPNEMSVLRLARTILKLTGSRSRIVRRPLPVDDPKQRCPDISQARRELGWTPVVALEPGLDRTIAYFKTLLKRR
jgi:dTDP-glucose 4,6-dehydratase